MGQDPNGNSLNTNSQQRDKVAYYGKLLPFISENSEVPRVEPADSIEQQEEPIAFHSALITSKAEKHC